MLLAVQSVAALYLGLARSSNLVSLPIDVLVGLGLLLGSSTALAVARFRTWVGLILGTGMVFAQSGGPAAAFAGVVLAGLLLLLYSVRNKLKMILGGLLCCGGLLLSSLGVLAWAAPIESLLPPDLHGKVIEVGASNVTTKDRNVRLTLPRGRWVTLRDTELNEKGEQLVAHDVLEAVTVRVDVAEKRVLSLGDIGKFYRGEYGEMKVVEKHDTGSGGWLLFEVPAGKLLDVPVLWEVKLAWRGKDSLMLSAMGPASTRFRWGKQLRPLIDSFPSR